MSMPRSTTFNLSFFFARNGLLACPNAIESKKSRPRVEKSGMREASLLLGAGIQAHPLLKT